MCLKRTDGLNLICYDIGCEHGLLELCTEDDREPYYILSFNMRLAKFNQFCVSILPALPSYWTVIINVYIGDVRMVSFVKSAFGTMLS